MTQYINTLTGTYPITESQIRAANPNTSFGQPFVAPEPYKVVFPNPQPAYNQVTHTCVEGDPVYTNKGHYEQTWRVENIYTTQQEEDLAIAVDLTKKKAAVWENIKAIRDLKTQKGGYFASGKWFHSDTFSRTQQMGLVMMGANVPAIQWKTMDGTFVTMTQALAAAIFQAAATHDSATFAHAELLKSQVDSSDNPMSIDINAGWPTTYE